MSITSMFTRRCSAVYCLRQSGFILLFFALMLMPALEALAQDQRYVSDNLTTWGRRGPGENYRISGTLQAGEAVTLLRADTASGYGEVRDSQGRTLWLPLKELNSTPSLRSQVPQLTQQVQTLSQQLATIEQQWNQRTADMQQKVAKSDGIIQQLQKNNEQLKQKLTVANKKVDAANLQLDDKQRTIIMQWFIYGGGVMLTGLLLGLVLPYMMPRRKKKDRWMN